MNSLTQLTPTAHVFYTNLSRLEAKYLLPINIIYFSTTHLVTLHTTFVDLPHRQVGGAAQSMDGLELLWLTAVDQDQDKGDCQGDLLLLG